MINLHLEKKIHRTKKKLNIVGDIVTNNNQSGESKNLCKIVDN